MRLINTRTLLMKEFMGDVAEPYAILSHRWGSPEDELSYKDYRKGRKRHAAGYKKIRDFCRIARQDNLDWAWVDTCCINKESSAELSEAINSMFQWYADARKCYVFLDDIGPDESWRRSVWWTRGWTLQELIAPEHVEFYDKNWGSIGSKRSHSQQIFDLTRVPPRVITNSQSHLDYPVAARLSWAATRQTTRIEDQAYCLLGLCNINMPLLYGEGQKAFQRLQLEILQQHADESVLAWAGRMDISQSPLVGAGVLAKSPSAFADFPARPILYSHWEEEVTFEMPVERHSPPRVTGWGIEIRTNAIGLQPRSHVDGPAGEPGRLCLINLAVPLSVGHLIHYPCMLVLFCGDRTANRYRRVESIYYPPVGKPDLGKVLVGYIVGGVWPEQFFHLQLEDYVPSNK